MRERERERERERGVCMSEYQKCKRGQRQGCCEAYEENAIVFDISVGFIERF